ncbi:MAG: alpha/beta hydrolase [Myxococcota bacterium]|nr:alpha/beta hydrolase [Myxococcota bacterium]
MTGLLNHPLITERYFFPRGAPPINPHLIKVPGATLACWSDLRETQDPLLVHFHGNGELIHDWISPLGTFAQQARLQLFLAEYRGYGASTGRPELGHLLEDVGANAEAIAVPPERVVVMGRSVGSIFAIEWVRRFPNTAGLIIESGIHDVYERLALRLEPHEVDLAALRREVEGRCHHGEVLSNFQGRSLFLHALNDQLVSASHARRNHAACTGPSELVLFPHGDHNSILYENQRDYWAHVFEYLRCLDL